jgi:hypothetical protein
LSVLRPAGVEWAPAGCRKRKKTVAGVGKDTKLTPSVIKKIAKSIGEGLPMKYAAMSAGIGYSTICVWMRVAKADDENTTQLHRQLLDEVQKARFKAIDVAMKQVNAAAKVNYKAAIWKMAMIDPDAFCSEGKLIRELKAIIERLTAKEKES